MAPGESNALGPVRPADAAQTSAALASAGFVRSEVPDEELVRRCCGGAAGAFDLLVARYQQRLFNMLARFCGSPDEAEDLTQDAFLQAFRALATFKQGARFYTWLFRIALNNALSKRRQAVRRRQHGENLSLDAAPAGDGEGQGLAARVPAHHDSDPAGQLQREWVRQRVREELNEIDPDYRAVLLLWDVEGMDYETIAQTLAISQAAVKSRLHRARLELARALKDVKKA